MPHKSFFTQGISVLLEAEVSLDDLADCVKDFEIVGRHHAADKWVFGGPSLLVSYRPDVNGYISIDIVNRSWPDHMGDPGNETDLLAAWSMGHFGPFTFPGSLKRATEQSWAWPEGERVLSRHHAFLRVRSSYVFGLKGNPPVLPEDYQPIPELMFVTRVARAVLDLPGALCYFNPNGECLANAGHIDALLDRQAESNLLPYEVWANVRLFNIPDPPKWSLMDTVGMWQLDATDHEACFDSDRYDPNEVAIFLRNAADYVLKEGPVIKDRDTMDGPGGIRWQAKRFEQGVTDPPRQVLRWFPVDGTRGPENLKG